MWAGTNLGAVTVKSNDVINGTIDSSAIFAGQLLDLDGVTSAAQLAKLALAKLGAISVTGSITNSQLVAGGSIGAVTVGKNLTDSLILAGAMFGGDQALGGGDDTFQRVAAIASVTVKGALARTSVAAGGEFRG